jgi:putative RecB family exonuclease
MGLPPPTSLSPSKVSTFTDCALAFRFSAIDRLPEPPSEPATKGTLVHAALERLFLLPAEQRTLPAALTALDEAFDVLRHDPDYTGLNLNPAGEAAFRADAEQLVRRYFQLEDPRTITPIGLELLLEADLGDLKLRGIIDRLELDDDGELVVTDYKTGRVPQQHHERSRFGGVHFYAFLCERLLGRRPARVQLLYLADPVAITTTPTDQSIRALERRVLAIWSTIERACANDSFQPRPSRLCDWCAFRAWCPAFGGDPAEARRLAEARRPAEPRRRRAGLATPGDRTSALPLASAG